MEQRKEALISPEQLQCPSGNYSIFICINENCNQSAFICDNRQCACLKKNHLTCNLQKTQHIIKIIEGQRKQISKENQNAFDILIQMYEEMIQKISKQKENLFDFIDMFGMRKNTRKFVSLIRDGNIEKVVGDLVHKTHIEIQQQGQNMKEFQLNENNVKIVYEKNIKEFDHILVQLKELWEFRINESKIIDHDGFIKIKSFMPKPCKEFQLLYRGSENRFLAQNFHQKCDGIEDTVTLVETQFGKVVGGFTPLKWQSPQQNVYKQDPQGKSFLFSVSLNEKYKLVQKQKAIKLCKDLGPTFGGTGVWSDLRLTNQCNNNNNSYAVFPTSYNNGKYLKNQTSRTAFSGQENGWNFKVKQYEVFKVIWK